MYTDVEQFIDWLEAHTLGLRDDDGVWLDRELALWLIDELDAIINLKEE